MHEQNTIYERLRKKGYGGGRVLVRRLAAGAEIVWLVTIWDHTGQRPERRLDGVFAVVLGEIATLAAA
jgi:hypothetical protein